MLFETTFVDQDIALDIRLYGKYLAFLRRHAVHACRVIWGIIIPPHEAVMLRIAWMGYKENTFTCSRGTSKSFTIGSLFSPTKALLFRGNNILIASASRFRGGKLTLKDSSNLIGGSLKNQKVGNDWGKMSLTHRPSFIKKDPDMWYMEFKSNSMVYTIPTNNDESIRGMRANIMILDERNSFDANIVQKVFRPFLNVGSDFENPALGSEKNQIFSVGTIDYSYKNWTQEIRSAMELGYIQYKMQRALQEKDWPTYDNFKTEYGAKIKNASFAIIRYDYTDLLIPTTIGNYKVNYPGANTAKQIKYDERDGKDFIYTYPIEKKQLEDPLDNGIVDRETWEAEQRNVFIQADGNVFPYELIDKVTGPIFSQAEEKKKGWDAEVQGTPYLPPVLYECTDPCVLGVDVARTSDFSAFVVIRIGYLSQEFFEGTMLPDYNLKEHRGSTSWSNVIWAEQHQQMTTKEVADKIRELRDRYNLVATRSCPGIVIDLRGGGVNVRDELALPSPDVDHDTGLAKSNWEAPQKIFDPESKDERMGKDLLADPNAWFGLKVLDVSDLLNQELVGFVKAQMQTGKLLIGSSKSNKGIKDISDKNYFGLVGMDTLKHQLLRIQSVLTPTGRSVKYGMPGSHKDKIENKKDMFSAFLYAGYGLKQFITDQTKQERSIPVTYGEVLMLPRNLM